MAFLPSKALVEAAFLLGCFVYMAVFGLTSWYKHLKRARLIEDLPTSRTRSAAQGYVELMGHQYAVPEHATHAPLTGTPCTWWRYQVEQLKRDFDGKKRWETLEQAVSKAPILFKDGKGQMLIYPQGAEVRTATKDRWQGSEDSPPRPMPVLDERRGRFRYTEERMNEGDLLYVMGELHTPASRHSSITVDDACNDRLNRWKHNQPELIRRFDANDDGRIDSVEWEVARETARTEVETQLQAHARDTGTALDIVRKPGDGQPFILATKAQVELASKYRLYARNNLILFVCCGACALYLFHFFHEIFMTH